MKYDTKLIGLVTVFENVTKARVKDAFLDKRDVLVFVVEEGDGGKAIGKMGNTVRRVSMLMKRRIRIIEFNNDVLEFVKNVIDPVKDVAITKENDSVVIKPKDTQTKGLLVGRERSNINEVNLIVKKFFKVDVKVS